MNGIYIIYINSDLKWFNGIYSDLMGICSDSMGYENGIYPTSI